VKPAPFEYHCPRTLDQALTLLDQYGADAKPLAGGQSLIPAMNFRLATPSVLVDLNAIAELSHVSEARLGLEIGAMTRHREVERHALVAQVAPLLRAAMPYVAHPAIRTRGTIGGSLAHADPAAELPAVMLALDASVAVASTRGRRVIRATDFFTGLFSTALESGELLTDIFVPVMPPQSRVAFQEVSRRHGDFALAGAAAMITRDQSGQCTTARVAVFSVGDRPVLAEQVRQLEGTHPTAATIRAAAESAAARDIDPPGDIHASSRYRRHLAGVLIRRVLEEAFAQVTV
jgi:CO/xanthine dehydrogenase FAD-binding subunit